MYKATPSTCWSPARISSEALPAAGQEGELLPSSSKQNKQEQTSRHQHLTDATEHINGGAATPAGRLPSKPVHFLPQAYYPQQPEAQHVMIESCLNVNLLKERVELELSLKREGLRFFLTLIFGFLFAYTHLLAFAPAKQYETSWLVTEKLGLASKDKLASTREAYNVLMDTARAARVFYPLSSFYMENGLAKTLIEGRQKFLNGQKLLPLDNHPVLPMEWSIYFRLRLEDWKNTMPKRQQLISEHTRSGGQDLTCWGLYAKGLYQYILVYGDHNLEGGAVELDFEFDRETARTDPLGLSLVALSVNATHATVMLEDAGENGSLEGVKSSVILPGVATRRLPAGTQPTDCQSGSYYIGDEGLELASMEFQPFLLTQSTFHDVQDVGQPLSQLVIGTARPPSMPSDEENSYQTEAHRTTHDLVSSGVEAIEGLVRLSGAISVEGADAAYSMATDDDEVGLLYSSSSSGLDPDGSVLISPHDPPLSNTTGNVATPSTTILGEGVVAELPSWAAELIIPTSLASNLTSAFSDLSARGQMSFTLEWWASADDLSSPAPMVEVTRESISFADAATGLPRLTVEYVHGGDLPVSGGWIVRFNHAPACLDTPPGVDTALCMQSPAFWCQAADSGTHDGLWRHFGLRFSGVNDTSHSNVTTDGDDETPIQRLDLFQDGTSICGVSFPTHAGLVPHGVDASPHVNVDFRNRGANGENQTNGYNKGVGVGAISVKNLRLHSHALSDSQVLAMASQPHLQECLPLHLMTDNPDYASSFGQTCADLAEQHSPAAGSSADPDGGCALYSAIRNCPVSCRDFKRPLCFDGTLPSPLPGQSPFGNVTKSFLYEPVAHRHQFPGYGDDAYWAAVAQRGTAQWTREYDQRKDWIKLFNMVENMRYGTVLTANDLKGRTSLDPIWRVPASSGGGLRCPGEELGVGVFSHICSSEKTHQGIMDDLVAQGRSGDDVNIAVNFKSGAMAAGSSFSMFMWARRRAMDDIHIVGIDDENNLCFDLNSSHAVMARNGMLADGPVSDVEEALRSGIVPIELDRPETLADTTASAKLEGEWTFFALSVDAETEEVTFGRNDHFTKRELQGLKAGRWGCNGLKFIISVGGDLSISPISVRATPMTASGMQQLHLATLPVFRHVVAPRHSRRDRLTPLQRHRVSFTSAVVGVAPILLLHEREAAGDALASTVDESDTWQECQNVVASQVSSQLIRNRELACSSVYECALNQAVLPSECAENKGRSAGETRDNAFFGHIPQEYKGRTVYPEFAWALDNEILVRDGQVLYPSEDYVDYKTTSVRVLSCLYNYKTHVAAILEADYDLRGLEVIKTVSVKQVKLLTAAEYDVWEGLMIGTVLLVVIVLVLAIPAAIEEGRSVWKALHRKRDAVAMRMSSTFGSSRLWSMSKFRVSNPMKYTADTTQPDILDVAFFSGILLLLVTELGTKRETLDMVADAFGDLAEKEWGSSELTFTEEMDTFLTKVQRAESRMDSENIVKIMGFVILLMVGVRLVVFMKVHPRVATITRTFETVSTELLNFCFSFGIIFVFMALTAHLRFGSSMEAFSTFRKALLTQFMVLLTVDLPDFGTDVFMTIYVAGYVVLCALSLLNFFLAIVVNGYTKVSEDVLENKVVNSIGKDILLVFRDLWIWPSKRWLDKTETLNILARAFPRIFENGYAQADTYKEQLISREEFIDVFTTNSIAGQAVQQQRSRRKSNSSNRLVAWVSRGWKMLFTTTTNTGGDSEEVARIAGEMFDHYMRQFNRTVLVASRMSFDVSAAGKRAMNAEALHNDFAMAVSQTSKSAPSRSELIGARSNNSDDGACSHTSLEILSQLR
eukprot:CAMPEP_0177753644 /NCGR_PEP_ID=MMETSP0491_2-20121128/1573_1 /TAXON_ID=63592 /ORGANISM="Tetraselmis chuii, Strain PLY429" /LENGTH=1824 /DNA_ID=CAMNT_0019268949 /DNA_START=404 /DNA_END=5878 /DNA_ORIENTATION=-